MAVKVSTRQYEFSRGKKPVQPRTRKTSLWAFQIDGNNEPVFIIAAYKDALAQAVYQATHTVVVLP